MMPMILITLLCAATSSNAQTLIKGRRSLVLEGRVAQLVVDIGGGSFTNFHLRSQGLSPLQWGQTDESTAPRPMGHFLCLDRWGAPSEAEQKNGMSFHGEAAYVEWQVLEGPIEKGGQIRAEMSASLPLAGLTVKRRIALSVTGPFFIVREEVTNAN